MPEREKLKTQNCKRIGQKARVLHDRKRMLKQSELQITEQENCSYLLQNEIYVVVDGASRERESFDIWRHRNPFLTTYGPPTFFYEWQIGWTQNWQQHMPDGSKGERWQLANILYDRRQISLRGVKLPVFTACVPSWYISAVNLMFMIMNFSQVSPSFPHSDKLRELVYLGIPHSMRAPVSTDTVWD